MFDDDRDFEEERYWAEFCDHCGTTHLSQVDADEAHAREEVAGN